MSGANSSTGLCWEKIDGRDFSECFVNGDSL